MRPSEDDFPSMTESPELVAVIRQRIAAEGPITFRDFMALALYHPRHGYYCSTREKMGRLGDYLTSPEVHPVFGSLVAKQIAQMWQLAGEPQLFTIVELGPGSGALTRDVLAWADRRAPQFFAALEYRLIEISEALAERQRRVVLEAEPSLVKASWLPSLAALPRGGVTGCFLSNEFFDSFPVHRVLVQDGRLCEVYVEWRDDGFREIMRPPSTPEIEEYFRRLGRLPGEGCFAEVNLEAPQRMKEVGKALARGFVLTFDYGYPAEELYAPWRRDGTLLCFYRHAPSNDPYSRIGRQDMTSHVDFTSLVAAGEEEDLQTVGITSQSRFLAALGIGAGLKAGPEGGLSLEEYYARRRAVTELTDPAGLGRISVLIQAKGIERPQLQGLEENDS